MRLLAPVLALAAAAAMLVVPAAPSAEAAATVVDPAATSLTVSVAPSGNGVVRPGEDLSVLVTVTNPTTSTVGAGSITLGLDRTRVASRDELTERLASGTPSTAAVGLADAPTAPLASGGSQVLGPLVVPAASVGLPDEPTAFGVYELTVVATTDGATTGQGHVPVTWVPAATSVRQVQASAIVALTVPEPSDGVLSAEQLAEYTAPDGTLTRQLDEYSARPVTIGVDPRIPASIRLLGDTAPDSVVVWSARLGRIANETFPLAWADADIAAISQAGGGTAGPISLPIDAEVFAETAPTPSASATPEPTAEPPAPTMAELLDQPTTYPGLVWPADGTVTAADLATFTAGGATRTVVGSAQIAASGPVATVGDASVIVSDSELSAELGDAITATTDIDAASALSTATAQLALLATADGPGTVVVALPREASAGTRFSQALDVLGGLLPWQRAAPLSTALATPAADAALTDSPEDPARVERVRQLLAAEQTVTQFATVLDDPTDLTGPHRLDLLTLTSHQWTMPVLPEPEEGAEPQPTDFATAVAADLVESSETVAAVRLAESSTFNILADRASIPITISNDLDFPATVYVTVQPRTAILTALENPTEITVEANSQNRVLVPVQSNANGEVTVQVSLASSAGVVVSQPATVVLNVQAQWETAVTAVVGVLLVLLFVFGIVRTIRRRRRVRRIDEDAAA